MQAVEIRTTDAEIEQLVSTAPTEDFDFRRARRAAYLERQDLLRLLLVDGTRLAIPRQNLQGLRDVPVSSLKNIEILGTGTAIYWPELGTCFSLTGLMLGHYGNPGWMHMLEQEQKIENNGQEKKIVA